MRDLKPGDVVHVQGIVCEIAEIAWQEPWDWREAYYLEFRDTNGIYRSWKQNFDGGYAELRGEWLVWWQEKDLQRKTYSETEECIDEDC